MECDLCLKPFGPSTPCLCVVCAQNSIYPLRIEQATVLLEKERLGKHVEAIIKGSKGSGLQGSESSVEPTLSLNTSTGAAFIDRSEAAKRTDIERLQAEAAEGQERVQLVTDKANSLRQEIEKLRNLRAEKQAANARKTSELSSATAGLGDRRETQMMKIQSKRRGFEHDWDAVHAKSAKDKAYLCRAAALLMGLKLTKRRSKDGQIKDVYYLASNKVFDLRDMHLAQPDPLSSSLNNVAMLLVRASHYLAVRLPAEITLAHKDYPKPTIYPPLTSYTGRDVPFPGNTSSQSTHNSPEASRFLDQDLPRARPLYVDRPLPQLSKEDPPAYKMFIEGVCLLAWDVAWLCRSQGLQTDFSKWEEICNIGRNLHHLLIIQPSVFPVSKDIAKVMGKETPKYGATPPMSRTPSSAIPINTLGQQSHGAAHSFLNVAGNSRSWKIVSLAQVVDCVKNSLTAEMQGAEWEVLNEDEWLEMDAEVKEEPIIVGPKHKTLPVDGRSILTTITEGFARADMSDDGSQGRAKGVNGWMKLKSRPFDGGSK